MFGVNVIFETKDFNIALGKSELSPLSNVCYKIRNKRYGITEHETSNILNAYQAILKQQELLDALREKGYEKV